MTDYHTLSSEQFLDALERAGRAPDPNLIRVCLERRAELTPGLLELLAANGDEDWANDDPRWYRQVHAGLLLIAFREAAALPIFARILRDKNNDALWEWFDRELAVYGSLATSLAIDILNDLSAYNYARIASTTLLTEVALQYPEERARVLTVLRAVLPPLDENGQLILPPHLDEEVENLWTFVANALAELHDRESRPQIAALYKAKLLDEMVMGGVENYLEILEALELPPGKPFDILELYEGLNRAALQEAEARARYEQARKKEQAEHEERKKKQEALAQAPSPPPVQQKLEPYVRSQPRVGRNEPCPCGSGKKYKHCHGK